MVFSFYNESLIILQLYNTQFIDDKIAFVYLGFNATQDSSEESVSFEIENTTALVFVMNKEKMLAIEECETQANGDFLDKDNNQPIKWNSTNSPEDFLVKFTMSSSNCSIGFESTMAIYSNTVSPMAP